MAFHAALNRLRRNEDRLEEDNSCQTRPQSKQPVQVNRVFSLDEEEDDIFDIDSDIFGSVDAVFSSVHLASLTDARQNSRLEGYGRSNSSTQVPSAQPSSDSVHTHSEAPTMCSLSVAEERRYSRTEANVEQAPHSTDTSRPTTTPSPSPSPSPSSVESLKSFTFTKTQKRTDSSDSGSTGFKPPAKRINLSTSPPCSPTDNDHSLLGQNLLAAFISAPDDDKEPSTHRVVHDSHSSDAISVSALSTGYSRAVCTQAVSMSGNVLKPTFKIPKSHSATSTNPPSRCNTTTASSSLPVRPLPKAHTVSTTATGPHHHSHTPASTTLTHTPYCTASTLHSTTTSFGQIASFAQSTTHPLSNRPSTAAHLSSAPSPVPPSPFSTPQRVYSTTSAVRRRFPGPAGILPALAPGQSMDGIVIPTPSLPTPSSTPRMKTLLDVASKFHPTSSQPADPDISGTGGPPEFSEGPWIAMLRDLDMNDVYSAPLLQYSIARVIKQASQQKLKNGKVTHLRVLLKSIVPACRNTSAVLKDPTGEILCTIHQSVMEDHRQELQPGAVIILRQVTVFSPAPRKHYLSITPDNIVIIYPSSATTTLNDAKTICLTEVEKRFRDQTSTKENSPQNHPQSTPRPPPASYSREQTLTGNGVHTHHHLHQFVSAEPLPTQPTPSLGSLDAAPHTCTHLQGSHDKHLPSHNHHHHHTESIFTNQLCEDEFDSIMEDFGSEMDF